MRNPLAFRSTVEKLWLENRRLGERLTESLAAEVELLIAEDDAVSQLIKLAHHIARQRIKQNFPGVANSNPVCLNCDVFKRYQDMKNKGIPCA